MKFSLRHSTLAVVLAAWGSSQNLAAQNAPVPLTPPPVQPAWETVATAGLTLTKGNSDTMLANLGIASAKKWNQNEVALAAGFSYGENAGTKNVDNVNGSAQYNRLLSENAFLGLKLNAVKDAIADLEYRVTISPLVGYYFIKETNTLLRAEIGPSYILESLGGVNKSYAGLRVGERFEHKFNDRAKMWEAADFIPQVDRLSKYVVTAELGVDSVITGGLSLRAVLQDTYDNIPALGRKSNDIRLITGIAYKF